ncbi:fluoride efflux transporter FluC [Mumia zhuanghuii]|uniref:Fluoride-specific ion channel FluC n=1 Tax=Mumia zhuanghuii TaxID=2585211 RepID=A0A5C4MP38_9ACTN|nr:CrcB family protein [Mumia zhuanghuii]TNC46123.1 CrcB family protein [Mumia zhuanghuii]TNC48852.1 CrcB family protein [Mumia zhuanghuii]
MWSGRRVRRRLRLVAVVAAGGAVGTLARALLAEALPHVEGQLPYATLIANVSGAFLLGLLLERLLRAGAETPGRRLVRLGLGTGVLGGFTTFSGLGLEVTLLARADAGATALAYALGSVVLGLAACLAGVAIGARRGRSA